MSDPNSGTCQAAQDCDELAIELEPTLYEKLCQPRQSSKKFELKEVIRKGAYIDAKDSINHWCLGLILDVCHEDESLLVRFDGWSAKWNEWFYFTHSKLAALRKYSKGYTGQKGNAIRDWVYNRHEVQDAITTLQDVLQNGWKSLKNPCEITQFFRAHLFVLIDCLLTKEDYTVEELVTVIELIQTFIKVSASFLMYFTTLLNEYNEGCSNQDLFLVNEKTSIAFCLHEILESLSKIFGSNVGSHARCSVFFRNFDAVESCLESCTKTTHYADYVPHRRISSRMMNEFGEAGGFDSLQKIMEMIFCSEKNPLHLKAIIPLLCLIRDMGGIIQRDKFDKLVNFIINNIGVRTANLTQKEIKDLDREFISDLNISLKYCLRNTLNENDLEKIIENMELNIALIFLKSPILEKKLKGLEEIRKLAESIENSETNLSCQNNEKSDKFIKWMLDQEVIEFLLGGSSHVEMIKRSHELLKFIAKRKKFPNSLIDTIIQSTHSKHEAVLKALFDVIAELANILQKESLDYLDLKINKICKQNLHQEAVINLLKSFSINAHINIYRTNKLSGKQLSEMSTENSDYGLELLWEACLDSSNSPTVICEHACNAIVSVLKHASAKMLRGTYINKCLSNLNELQSYYQSLVILLGILKAFPTPHSSEQSQTEILLKNPKIIEIVVESIQKYFKCIQVIKGTNELMFGRFSHEKILAANFNVIEYVVVGLGGPLGKDNLLKLWDVFITPCTGSVSGEGSAFFRWLSKPTTSVSDKNANFLSEEEIFFLYNTIFKDENRFSQVNLTMEGFTLFRRYFILYFASLNVIKQLPSGKFEVYKNDPELEVLPWALYLKAQDTSVLEPLCHLLVSIQKNLHSDISGDEIWGEFLLQCVRKIKNGGNIPVQRVTHLMVSFLATSDDYETYDEQIKHLYQFKITVALEHEPENQKQFNSGIQFPLSYIKYKTSQIYGIPMNALVMHDKTHKNIDADINELTIKDIGNVGPFYFKVLSENEIPHDPKEILLRNKEIREVVFQLLGDPNNEVSVNIWNLLNKIPKWNNSIESIKNFSIPLNEAINESTPLLSLYYLEIIYNCINPPKKPMDIEFLKNFSKAKGSYYLEKLFLSLNISKIWSILPLKKLYSLLLIIKLTIVSMQLIEINKVDAQKECTQMLDHLNWIVKTESANMNEHRRQIKTKAENEEFHQDAEVVKGIYDYLYILIKACNELLIVISSYPDLNSLLELGSLHCGHHLIRSQVCNGLSRLLTEFSSTNQIILPKLLNGCLSKIFLPENLYKSFDLLNLLYRVISVIPGEVLSNDYKINMEKLIEHLVSHIEMLGTLETDAILRQVLCLVKLLFEKKPTLKISFFGEKELLKKMLHKYLFDINPVRGSTTGAICRSDQTRSICLDLLLFVISDQDSFLDYTMSHVSSLLSQGMWRTKDKNSWNLEIKSRDNNLAPFLGIKNLACICYMNSLLQQLFMIQTFRKAVLEVEDLSFNKIPPSENLLFQFKMLFASLLLSNKSYVNPKNLCAASRDWDGNQMNVLEQMDTYEFFTMFIDRLEESVKGTKLQHFIKEHFGGYFSSETSSKDCGHTSEVEEPFLALTLDIKDKSSVQKSLESFVAGEMLEGENAYYCDRCAKKVAAMKVCTLKKLPNHLLVVLKRFEYDYDIGHKVKINDFVEFPSELNLYKYSHQGLHANDKRSSDDDEEKYPQSYFEYVLAGVIVHMGSSDSGHYYSFIMDRDTQKWYEFNDDIVRPFDPKNIPNECFGGEEKNRFQGTPLGEKLASYFKYNREKIRNGYFLVYDRKEKFYEEMNTASKKIFGKPGSSPIKSSDPKKSSVYQLQQSINNKEKDVYEIPKEYIDSILRKNKSNLIYRYIFSKSFLEFVNKFTSGEVKYECCSNKTKNAILKACVHFFLTCGIREKDKITILAVLPFIKTHLKTNLEVSYWLLLKFSSTKIIAEFLLECPIPDMRLFVVGILKVAMETVYNEEGKTEKNFLMKKDSNNFPTTVLGNFTNALICHIHASASEGRDPTHFYAVLYNLSLLGQEMAHYLIEKKTVGRLLDVFYFDVSPHHEYFQDLKDSKFKETDISDIGSMIEKSPGNSLLEQLKKKNEQALADSLYQKNKYLWAVVGYLGLFFKIKKECYLRLGSLEVTQTPQEAQLINPTYQYLARAISDSNCSRIAYTALAKLYAYLSFEDQKTFRELTKAVFSKEQLPRKEYPYQKSFIRVVFELLSVKDSMQQKRIETLTTHYMTTIEENKTNNSELVELIKGMVKMIERIPGVREYYLKNIEKFANLFSAIENEKANIDRADGGIILIRQKYQIKASTPYRQKVKYLYDKIAKLKHKDIQIMDNEWDSEHDMSNYPLKPGDFVDYCTNNIRAPEWVSVQVTKVLDEMLLLTYAEDDKMENKNHINPGWVQRDTDFMAPKGVKLLPPVEEIDTEDEGFQWNPDEDHDKQPSSSSSSEEMFQAGNQNNA